VSLAIGCRYVVSFDDFASGSGSALTAGRGGAGGASGGGGPGGAAVGGAGTGQGGNVVDASPDTPVVDARPDRGPRMPVTIYTAPMGATIGGITVDATYLYWAEGGRGIFRMLKAGLQNDAVFMHRASLEAFDVAVDDTYLYWADRDYFVWAMPRDGDVTSTPTQWFSHNVMAPRYIAVDNKQVVYVTIGPGDIVSGSPTASFHPFSSQTGIAGIGFLGATDAGQRIILWGHASGIRQGQSTGGKFDDLFAGGTDPVAGIATDGVDMVWISNNDMIKKGQPASASQGDTGCISPPQDLGPNADIALDDQWIYFTWPNKNEIDKCPRY